MKRKILQIILVTIFTLFAHAQTTVVAEKEKLSMIYVGIGNDKVSYESNEEGFYSPEGPIVDKDGRLLFYPSTTRDFLRGYYKEKWESLPSFKFLKNTTGHQILFVSQQGVVMVRETIYVLEPGYGDFYFSADMGRSIPSTYEYSNYILPFGGLIESRRPVFTYSTEVLPDRTIKVRDLQETRSWLPTQPGGFTIGDDGLLYRNGMLWSAIRPKDTNKADKYVGRLASGHIVWTTAISNQTRYITVATTTGITEITLELPWGRSPERKDPGFYDWGLGPWGEVYCLIPPVDMWTTMPSLYGGSQYAVKDFKEISEPAELVVVRNHLKYFGRLNDGSVRLRKEPNTASEILGTYPAKTGFRILERTGKNETIAGMTSDWVKVRLLDGKEGWFFGAFVHNLYDGPNGNPPPWPNVPDW